MPSRGRRVRDAVRRRLADARSLAETTAAAHAVLAEELGVQAAAWSTVDPATTLSTSCVLLGELAGAELGPDTARETRLFELEWADDAPNTFWALARSGRVAAGLVADVGDPRLVPRYVELLAPLGVLDELRISFRLEGSPWGTAILYRSEGGPFTAEDVAVAAESAATVATALRRAILDRVVDSAGMDLPPGMLLLTERGQVVTTSVAAEALLAGQDESTVRVTLANLAAGVQARGEAGALTTSADGALRFHASPAKGADGAVAVVVERPRPIELTPLIMAALGLTPKEREITQHLLLGRDRRAIARAVGVAEATLGDHLKQVYRKAGVASRSELAARLFGEWYHAPRAAGVAPGPYGYFVPDPPPADLPGA